MARTKQTARIRSKSEKAPSVPMDTEPEPETKSMDTEAVAESMDTDPMQGIKRSMDDAPEPPAKRQDLGVVDLVEDESTDAEEEDETTDVEDTDDEAYRHTVPRFLFFSLVYTY